MTRRLADAGLERVPECDCPPQTERCLHFNAVVVRLTGSRSLTDSCREELPDDFDVGVTPENCPPHLAERCGQCLVWYRDESLYSWVHLAQAAAQAAFDAAADRLRAGELP